MLTPHAGVAQLVERLLPKTTRLQRCASCSEQLPKIPGLDGLTPDASPSRSGLELHGFFRGANPVAERSMYPAQTSTQWLASNF